MLNPYESKGDVSKVLKPTKIIADDYGQVTVSRRISRRQEVDEHLGAINILGNYNSDAQRQANCSSVIIPR
jgi:hypothetical protein